MKITLKEFFQTGNLGLITIGMSRQEIESYIGYGELYSSQKMKLPAKRFLKAETYGYGSLELSFENDVLKVITLVFETEFQLPISLGYEGYFPCSQTTHIQEVVNFLDENHISYQYSPDELSGDFKIIVTEGGTNIRFYADREGDNFKIDKIVK